MMRVKSLVFFLLVIIDTTIFSECNETNKSEISTDHRKVKRSRYNDKMKEDLIKIWYETSPETYDHITRLYQNWAQLYPEHAAKIKPKSLRTRARSLIKSQYGSDSFRKTFNWTDELNSQLIQIWCESSPGKLGHVNRMQKKWSEIHPEYAYMPMNYLKRQAISVINKKLRELEQHKGEKLQQPSENCLKMGKRFRWTEEADSNLIRIYEETPNSKNQRKEVQKRWAQLYPKHASVSAQILAQRMKILRELRENELYNKAGNETFDHTLPKKRFEWTEQANADLLRIWEETLPFMKGHKTRINKCWARLHPEYPYFNHETLRKRAQRLIGQGYTTGLDKGRDSPDGDQWLTSNHPIHLN